MTSMLGVILIGIAIIFAMALIAKFSKKSIAENWPFYKKKPLSQPEQILYHRLIKSLPEYIVLAQVQASRILGVKKGYNFHQWNNRISRLSLDYVICAKDSTVIAAIELDDSSHNNAKRQEADQRKERALKSAGITLIRWSVKELPDEIQIRIALKSTNRTGVETPPPPAF